EFRRVLFRSRQPALGGEGLPAPGRGRDPDRGPRGDRRGRRGGPAGRRGVRSVPRGAAPRRARRADAGGGGLRPAVPGDLRGYAAPLRRLRGVTGRRGARRAAGDRAAAPSWGEAPADAVEPPAPADRVAAARGARRGPLGVLRALLRGGGDLGRDRDLRLRRARHRGGPAGAGVRHPVPPREVGGHGARRARQLRAARGRRPLRRGPREELMDLYPAIDLLGGRCVRLYQGDYDRETVYGDDPIAQARSFEAAGAPWIHVVDLDAARTGEPVNRDVVASIAAAVSVPVQAGGGVRDEAAADALFSAGVARVVLGTAAIEDPALVRRLAARHPVAVGLDARGREVAVRGWLEGSGADVID